MSIRQFFGNDIKPPKVNEIVQYVNEVTGTIDIKNVTINGNAGNAGEVIASNGLGQVVWGTGGEGPVTTDNLAQVMERGNTAGADLAMEDFSILGLNLNLISTGDLVLNATGAISLVAGGGYGFTNGIGEEGQVLVSYGDQGANWINPQIPTITSNLDMNNNGIENVASIAGVQNLSIGNLVAGGQITFLADSVSVFVETPQCANIPTQDNQLVNKAYADSLIVQAGAVTPAGDNNFTGDNIFNGDTTFEGPVIINGAGFDQVNTISPFSSVYTATNSAITANHRKHFVSWAGTGAQSYLLVPDDTAAYDGCELTVINNTNITFALRAWDGTTGRLRNFTGLDNYSYANDAGQVYLHDGRSVTLQCQQITSGVYRWCVVSTSDAQLSFTAGIVFP